jgi:hypothetical protein
MSTYRERREARAARLQEWAEKRETRAAAVFKSNEPYTSDYAFNTQPGHIPVRSRIIRQEDRAFESLQKADSMKSRADSILAAADHAIYSDDPDAIERLRERISELEAKREQMKAANAAYRKEHRAELKEMTPYQRHHAVPFPSYALTNLSGNLTRNKKRLAALEAKAAREEQE